MNALRRARPEVPRVLVVDDEADIRELLELTLSRMGLAADGVGTLAEARRALSQRGYQLCLTDMRLPDGDGLELVRHIARTGNDLPVAVITAYSSMENAVAALKAGAFDYLAKPVALEQLRALVRSAVDLPSAQGEADSPPAHRLLGESPAMQQVMETIEKLARSQAPVYIHGESGTGKERAARLIHELGARRAAAFVPVNCGAIPENLMESEFFGYKKGSFTGADADRDGFFQAAQGGTLFLDEVAELPLAMQVKLLRAIQEKRVRKIGAAAEEPVDVRIISATHQNLASLVGQGRFRQDLFYRIDVIELRMPSLAECREDIPLLAGHILERLARESGVARPRLSEQALRVLQDYPFPGNVRELENVLERALALLSGSEIGAEDLRLAPPARERDGEGPGAAALPLQEALDRFERERIADALRETGFNRTAAARVLGVTFRSLRYRMQRLGMKP